jgi:uncharacterized protein
MKHIGLLGVILSIAVCSQGSLIISEIMYNPASSEPAWEWIELYNSGPAAVDLAGYVIDDDNTSSHARANIGAGMIASDGLAVLYNADSVSAADFTAAWGGGLNLIAVSGWSAMGLNNSGDRIGLWSSFSSYSGDHETHTLTVSGLRYGAGGAWPGSEDGTAIYRPNLSADGSAGASWASCRDAAGSFQSLMAGGNVGGEWGSPGVFVGVVPEPAAIALIGVSTLLMLIFRRIWG